MRTIVSLCVLSTLGLASVGTAQWTQIQTNNAPSARAGAQAAYDAARGQTVLFGGEVGFSFSNETWLYDGRDWSMATPATQPAGRAEAALVSNPLRGVVLMYGGNAGGGPWGGPANDETWEWNGTDWTMITPTVTPGGLTRAGAAFDIPRNRMVVYGGLADSSFPIASAGTWEYDGATWAQVTTAASPGPREGVAMCYDRARNKVVLFGGLDPQVGGFADTWEYDGTNWTRLPASVGGPAARSMARMVFDTSSNVCVLYGGMDVTNGNLFNDVWQFDGTAWTQVATGGLAARRIPAAAFDAGAGHTVLFGGIDSRYTTNSETWEFGARWDELGSGCSGSVGPVALAANSRPVLGQSLVVSMTNMNPASTLAFLAFGFSDTTWGTGTLPADLTSLGLTGCMLYTSPDVLIAGAASAGSVSFSLPIPATQNLVGMRFWNQGFAVDNGHNPVGIVTSNAGAALVGY